MKKLVLLGISLLFVHAVQAETRYVTDLLRLSVYELPQSEGKIITTLRSGDALTILETQPGYAKVQTLDGQTGWTKSAYLVSDKPARLIVSEKDQQLESLQQALAEARSQASSARDEASKYRHSLQASEETVKQQNEQLQNYKKQNLEYADTTEAFSRSIPLNIFLIACAVLFCLGILLGWYIIDYRIRKRHGGFRI